MLQSAVTVLFPPMSLIPPVRFVLLLDLVTDGVVVDFAKQKLVQIVLHLEGQRDLLRHTLDVALEVALTSAFDTTLLSVVLI